MTGFRFLVVLATVGVAINAGGQTPIPVAEKITTHLGRTTRVSLFSNRQVVVSVHSESDRFVHRTELDPDAYMVYLQSLENAARSVGRDPVSSDVESRDSTTTIVLYVGPHAPTRFTYSPLASLDLPLGRIAAIMDDLRDQALDALPGELELSRWEPAVGDCVELRLGGVACVTAIEEDGSMILEREDVAVTYSVPKEERAQIILKLVRSDEAPDVGPQ